MHKVLHSPLTQDLQQVVRNLTDIAAEYNEMKEQLSVLPHQWVQYEPESQFRFSCTSVSVAKL